MSQAAFLGMHLSGVTLLHSMGTTHMCAHTPVVLWQSPLSRESLENRPSHSGEVHWNRNSQLLKASGYLALRPAVALPHIGVIILGRSDALFVALILKFLV